MRYVVALLLFLSLPALAEVPANRVTALSRGVNLIDVFSDKSLSSLKAEIEEVHRAGFRHIRFFIDPAWVWRTGEPAHLDQVLNAAFAANLAVIICMQSYTKPFNAGEIEPWTTAWLKIATHYAQSNPDRLFFELINEPPFSSEEWTGIQEHLRQQVRKVVPRHTLLLTGSPTSTSYALAALQPSSDDNVAYVFHEYQPMIFTHQGADWADPLFGKIRGLQYPPTADNLRFLEHEIAPKYKSQFDHYAKAGKQVIVQDISPALEWSRKNHVPLVVTEFGVYRPFAPPASRAAWLHDVRVLLEQERIGWTVWEYNGGFGIKPELDVGCSQLPIALGLCR